eukprot:GCRY01000970.1.p1 GENE.GCRY01000970.1~~GCRY01000970.1.p1  ORF type:complete len:449 (+),score=67.74 GCRY01000970.1:277-1623(+)
MDIFDAISDNNYGAIETLLAGGEDVNQIDPSGRSPLMYAIHRGHEHIALRFLALDCDVDTTDKGHRTPLHHASFRGMEEVAKILLQRKVSVHDDDKNGQTPLHMACHRANKKIVGMLLENDANPNREDKYKMTPLHLACQNGYKKAFKIVHALLAAGAFIDTQDETGRTAIHHSIQNSHSKMALALLERGANINATDYVGHTPFHIACLCNEKKMAALLIFQGAKPNIQDSWGRTGFFIACEKGFADLALSLLEDEEGMPRNLNVNPLLPNSEGFTPVQIARRNGHVELAQNLDQNYLPRFGPQFAGGQPNQFNVRPHSQSQSQAHPPLSHGNSPPFSPTGGPPPFNPQMHRSPSGNQMVHMAAGNMPYYQGQNMQPYMRGMGNMPPNSHSNQQQIRRQSLPSGPSNPQSAFNMDSFMNSLGMESIGEDLSTMGTLETMSDFDIDFKN